jgi:hypothetical protein
VAWWLLDRLLTDDTAQARERIAVAATLLRVLAMLGPAPARAGEAARETELRALLLHGRLPRDEDEWALARSLFDDDALAVLTMLAGLVEGDGGDGGQPLGRFDGGADEVDLPGTGQDQE